MAKDTFFLRTTLTSNAVAYVSDNIDISAYTDPARGRVLVVDNAYITFSTDGQGPINASDITSGTGQTRSLAAQVCSEVQTTLVEVRNNSLFARSNVYGTASSATVMTMLNMTDALNPTTYKNGFIVPTSQIHCGIQTGLAWNEELDVGFLFEVHTEKLSLSRIQELLVSLTAN
jgi:hypothetical protein